MKFRKKPIIVEAWQWTPREFDEERVVFPSWISKAMEGHHVSLDGFDLVIRYSLGGTTKAEENDWIIGDVAGLWTAKPHIFEQMFDLEPEQPPMLMTTWKKWGNWRLIKESG